MLEALAGECGFLRGGWGQVGFICAFWEWDLTFIMQQHINIIHASGDQSIAERVHYFA